MPKSLALFVIMFAAVALGTAAPARAQQNPGSQVDIDEFRMPKDPTKIVKPNLKLLFGTWQFDAAASRFDNVFAPEEATRVYKDLGNGTYSYDQVTISLDEVRSETQYVGKDDGTGSELMRIDEDGAPVLAGITVSVRWVSAFAAEETHINKAGVITVTRREISPDGKTMVLTLPNNPFLYVHQHADDPVPDIMVFNKQK